jgi:predicted RNase H-like nuclease (RuvC/YqgF family)
MNIENITSNGMGLSNNGRFMQIEIYEKEIKRLQQELQRKDNNWNELKKYVEEHDDCWDLQAVLDKIKQLEESK